MGRSPAKPSTKNLLARRGPRIAKNAKLVEPVRVRRIEGDLNNLGSGTPRIFNNLGSPGTSLTRAAASLKPHYVPTKSISI